MVHETRIPKVGYWVLIGWLLSCKIFRLQHFDGKAVPYIYIFMVHKTRIPKVGYWALIGWLLSCKTFVCSTSMVHQRLELELIQTQMAQKPMLRAEVGMRVRCANKASAE
jgi:hypothetical protein